MQQFVINKNATLPYLEMEVIQDGRHDFRKIFLALQSATVTFSMWDLENGVKKIANEPCNIVVCNADTCDERYKLQYCWKKRDTNQSGVFIGSFTVKFNDMVKVDGITFPKGELLIPIAEELQIIINEGSVRNKRRVI